MNSVNTSFRPMNPDLGISGNEQISLRQPSVGGGAEAKGTGFLDALAKTMESVNETQLQADHAIKDIVAGKSKNIHETMLSIQQAELSLKTMMQVRNKILEAYKEIIRMQV